MKRRQLRQLRQLRRKTKDEGQRATKQVCISKAAKALINEYEIPLYELTGTGKNGNITKKDVEQYLAD